MQTDVREVSGCFHAHTSRVVGSLEVVRAGDEGRWRALLPLKEGRRLRAPTRSNFEFSKNLQRAVNAFECSARSAQAGPTTAAPPRAVPKRKDFASPARHACVLRCAILPGVMTSRPTHASAIELHHDEAVAEIFTAVSVVLLGQFESL
jgi:hypothetical protein